MTQRRIEVKPKSKRAKTKLANVMGGSGWCFVEQEKEGGEMLLRSENGQYSFWMSTTDPKCKWVVETWTYLDGDLMLQEDGIVSVYREGGWQAIE